MSAALASAVKFIYALVHKINWLTVKLRSVENRSDVFSILSCACFCLQSFWLYKFDAHNTILMLHLRWANLQCIDCRKKNFQSSAKYSSVNCSNINFYRRNDKLSQSSSTAAATLKSKKSMHSNRTAFQLPFSFMFYTIHHDEFEFSRWRWSLKFYMVYFVWTATHFAIVIIVNIAMAYSKISKLLTGIQYDKMANNFKRI